MRSIPIVRAFSSRSSPRRRRLSSLSPRPQAKACRCRRPPRAVVAEPVLAPGGGGASAPALESETAGPAAMPRRSATSTLAATMRPSGPRPDSARAALAAALDGSAGAGAAAGALRRGGAGRGRRRRRTRPSGARREVAATQAYLRLRDRPQRPACWCRRRSIPRSPASRSGRRAAALLAPLGTGPWPRCWQRLRAGGSGLCPADRREGAARGAGAGRRPGGRRWRTGPTLHPGETSPRVAELRGAAGAARLRGADRRAGRAPASTPGSQEAVQRFQRDYGLNDDGVVGAMTLAAINAPVETRLAQVRGQPRADALDERATRSRAISWSTSPTSP